MLCHFDYGDFVVESGSNINIQKLDILQNRSLRCIENCHDIAKRKTLDELRHVYNVEKLCVRRNRNLLKIMYDESRNIVNIDMYRPKMVLRSADHIKMHHKFTKLTKIQKSPYYRGLGLWDNLPVMYQNINTKKEFKSLIKQYKFRG